MLNKNESKMLINDDLKILLDRHFKNYSIVQLTGGATNSELFRIKISEQESYLVKKQDKSLQNDFLNYTWLKGKAPVPEIVFYQQENELETLCTTCLNGETLACYIGKKEPEKVIKHYADSLALLHAVKVDEYALVQKLDERISNARNRLDKGLVDISDLQSENKLIQPAELFEKVLTLRPESEELVFTHGDYCFDNIMFENDQLTGFIDLNNGGVADKYQDIALAVRNIQDNFGNEMLEIFFHHYQLNYINQKKIEFYTLLDEFF